MGAAAALGSALVVRWRCAVRLARRAVNADAVSAVGVFLSGCRSGALPAQLTW